jgi:Lipocalin-like domain
MPRRRKVPAHGTYSIDVGKRAVIHHIAGAWFPNLLHTKQLRHFRFAGSQLILDADTEWGKVRIVWKRAKPKSLHS